MTNHEFTLVVEGPDLQEPGLLNRLFEAGCDDATVASAAGLQTLDFDRKADSLQEAIFSAVAQVESLDPRIHVVRLADAGLVSMSDIAERTGRTRESVRLLVAGERGPGGFPAPVTDPRSRHRLWRWREVAEWFGTAMASDPETDDEMRVVINAGLELRYHYRRLAPDRRPDLTRIGVKA